MTKSLQDAIEKAKQDPNGLSDADLEFIYQQGRKDAIEQIEDWLKKEFVKQNNPNSKFVPTIVLNELVFTHLEQIKERKND